MRNEEGEYSERGETMGGMEHPTDLGLTASGLTDGCLEKWLKRILKFKRSDPRRSDRVR